MNGVNEIRCPDCGVELRSRRSLGGHRSTLPCRVFAKIREMRQRGWVPIAHSRQRDAAVALNAPHECAYVRYLTGAQGRRSRGEKGIWAPPWVAALLSTEYGGVFAARKQRLRYAIEYDLGEALTAWIATGRDPVDYLVDHALANGRSTLATLGKL